MSKVSKQVQSQPIFSHLRRCWRRCHQQLTGKYRALEQSSRELQIAQDPEASGNHVAEMIISRFYAYVLCVALAAATSVAGQGNTIQDPSIGAASSDIQLVTIDLSDTPFNSVQVLRFFRLTRSTTIKLSRPAFS